MLDYYSACNVILADDAEVDVEFDHQQICHKCHAYSYCSDVSYNNFTESFASGCQPSKVNLVSSHSSTESKVGKEVLKDFNIKEVAKGVDIGITREFDDILVNGSTLEIHLYWRGKGNTAIPDKGVYGPLISAITVTPNFDVSIGLSVGAIVGNVAASFVLLVLILVVLRMKGCLGGKDLENKGKISHSMNFAYDILLLLHVKSAR
ncbi:hypothetical protein RHSIM_Rhsim02G0134200 [Rhododendron simsii]|uniref:non-specific serine/threonine protein kinase n=1 Tax=Rhododendron simsii TaxID=118357 RepID=A0A834LRN5_RHOSS|nr:hypothetical protein RHSIM_Rhsim02G0134200 [Rhododendron simsii]